MKKLLPLVLIFGLIGGVVYWKSRSQNISQPTNQKTAAKTIVDWIKGSQGVRCQLDIDGNQVSIVAKGEKMKISGQSVPINGQSQKSSIINDGQWIYVWSEEDQKGIKYPVESENQENSETETFSLKEIEKEWAGYQYHCQPAKISDQEFIPPTEVDFLDIAAFTQQVEDLSQQADDNIQEMEEKIKEMQENFGGNNSNTP